MQTPVLHYYHSDHLGTTGYISEKDQNLVQHERYFAFGELWRPGGEQEETDLSRPDGDRREWLFTAKEWDVDTGLYYFGARYFDPHADVWQSTEPILAGYMRGAPNGGVFQPRNLGVYSYSWNNPIVLRDPTGHCVAMGTPGPCDEEKLATMEATRAYGTGFLDALVAAIPLLGDVDDARVVLTSNSAKERKEAVVSLGMGFGPVPNSGPLLRSFRTDAKAAAKAERAITNPKIGRFDKVHSGRRAYDDAVAAARSNAGNLGAQTQRMYDPKTGTLIGEQSLNGKQGWRIDDDHLNWWDWSGGKKERGGRYGHEFFPPEQAGPHSLHPGYAKWQ